MQTTISQTWHSEHERHWSVTLSVTADDLSEREQTDIHTIEAVIGIYTDMLTHQGGLDDSLDEVQRLMTAHRAEGAEAVEGDHTD